MTDYEHIHMATNARLAEMVEKVKEDRIEHFRVDEIEVLEEAARRLRIPPHRAFHEEYFGECRHG